jgi:DNA-directed RNA polymerase subunit RPC12/RpoP
MSVSKTTSKNNDNITIDAKHSEMINYFKNLQESVPSLKKELKNLISEYNVKDVSRKNDMEYILYKDGLRDKINELRNKIEKIINNEEMNYYYLEVGELLHSYYENIENSKNNKNNSEKFEENLINYDLEIDRTKDSDLLYDEDEENEDEEEDEEKCDEKKGNILDFFNQEKEVDKKEKEINYTSMKMSDFVKENAIFRKKNVLDEYLQKIDTNYIPKIKVDMTIYKCSTCLTEMTLYPSDGIQICEKCGSQENILIESDKPSFKDPPLEVCYFSYRRINHYNEWLAQFQAKESTEIPEEVYEKILLEIKKERITNLEKLDTKKIRQYLKKNKLNKYYDHAAHILYQINGVQPPSMSKELEEKLRLMFKEIQGPFMEVCPKSRKNFLNYSYVLHKFVELLGLDEYKIFFPLLKDREKLHQTDMIWKKICEKLGWHFIKSI